MEKTGWQLTAALFAVCAIGAGYAAWTFKAERDQFLDPGMVACHEANRKKTQSEECNVWGQRNYMISTRIKELTDQGFSCVRGQLFKRDGAGLWQPAGTCPKFTYE